MGCCCSSSATGIPELSAEQVEIGYLDILIERRGARYVIVEDGVDRFYFFLHNRNSKIHVMRFTTDQIYFSVKGNPNVQEVQHGEDVIGRTDVFGENEKYMGAVLCRTIMTGDANGDSSGHSHSLVSHDDYYDMHNDTNYHDYDDEPKNEKNETKNSKGFRTFEFTVSKTSMFDRLRGCGCALQLDDVCYSLVEFPTPCCLKGCKNEISLGAYINPKGSLLKYDNPSEIPAEYLAADGSQRGKSGTVNLRISLDILDENDLDAMRREVLATAIAHFLESKSTKYHPDAPKKTKDLSHQQHV